MRPELPLDVNARADYLVGERLKLMSFTLDALFHFHLQKMWDHENPWNAKLTKYWKAAKRDGHPFAPSAFRGFRLFHGFRDPESFPSTALISSSVNPL